MGTLRHEALAPAQVADVGIGWVVGEKVLGFQWDEKGSRHQEIQPHGPANRTEGHAGSSSPGRRATGVKSSVGRSENSRRKGLPYLLQVHVEKIEDGWL